MTQAETQALARDILARLKEFGADAAGFADVNTLRYGYSERLFPQMKDHARDHFADEITTGLPHGAVYWEDDAKSAILFVVEHPREKPEMDWWCGEIDPPGNKKLISISKNLRLYLNEHYPDVHIYSKRYHVERGGLYLKEAAVQAGLGCIGKNNLLVTPQFGPRVRIRAMTISEQLPVTGPIDFDPCDGCQEFCRKACPQKAFSDKIYDAVETGFSQLPGRDGSYYRASCNERMMKNEAEAQVGLMPEVSDTPEKIYKYCRNCELSCPVGR